MSIDMVQVELANMRAELSDLKALVKLKVENHEARLLQLEFEKSMRYGWIIGLLAACIFIGALIAVKLYFLA